MSAGAVQGLLGVVRGWGCRPAVDSARDRRVLPLALEALVGAVHVLHASRAPPRGPELRALLEGYFRVLNTDWPAGPSPGPEEALVALRVSMLGGYGLRAAREVAPGGEGPRGGRLSEGAAGRGLGRLPALPCALRRGHPHDAGL